MDLLQTFHRECDVTRGHFLVKTHWPVNAPDLVGSDLWNQFDAFVQIVRQPLAAIHSNMLLGRSGRHDSRERMVLTESDRDWAMSQAAGWVEHERHWREAPIPRLVFRYEDLRRRPLPIVMKAVDFLLPPGLRPSTEQVLCSLEHRQSAEPYTPHLAGYFSTWDLFEDSLRTDVLKRVAPTFCRYGYDLLAAEANHSLPFNCRCARGDAGLC